MARSDDEISTATTAEKVTQRMREDILGARFRSGDRLKIADFAALYGVSQMPVREALRRLEGEGLLDVLPHRGATVRGIDETFLRNLYDIREVLEGLLAERCAERADAAAFARIDACVAAHERVVASGKEKRLAEANRQFHAAIAAGAANPEAERLLETGRVLVESLRLMVGRASGRLDEIVTQHRAIRDAIFLRDGARAGSLSRAHVVDAREDLIQRFRVGRT